MRKDGMLTLFIESISISYSTPEALKGQQVICDDSKIPGVCTKSSGCQSSCAKFSDKVPSKELFY